MSGSEAGVRDIFVDANHLRHHLVSRGQPGAPVVFMIHGLSGQAHSFDGIATRLGSHYHVYCLDVRGRGESGWGKADDYHIRTYVEDLEHIRGALGIERFSLVGTSMGGLIALHYTPEHQAHVTRVVLNDIGPDIDTKGLERIRGYITDAPKMFPDLKAVVRYYEEHYSPMIAHLDHRAVEDFAQHHVRKNDVGVWVWKMDPAIRLLTQTPPPLDAWGNFSKITCPVLILRGQTSDVLSRAVADRMVAENKGAELVEVPDVGHAPVLTEPAAMDALETFLAS